MTTYDDPVPGGRPGDVERAQAIADDLAAHGVRGVVMSWIDTCGVNRVKTVPVARLMSAVRSGVGMSPVFDLFLADDSIVGGELQVARTATCGSSRTSTPSSPSPASPAGRGRRSTG